jgi:hypothetical protein
MNVAIDIANNAGLAEECVRGFSYETPLEFRRQNQEDNTESLDNCEPIVLLNGISQSNKNNEESIVIDFEKLYETDYNIQKDWNFNDMYIRSNSPIASNCNSDLELENSNQNSSIEDEFSDSSRQFKNKLVRRKFKEFIHKPNAPANNYYNEQSISQLNETTNKILENENYNKKYKKFTYEDIEKSLSKYYDKNDRTFTETELLITYLKGIRVLYTLSKNITKFKSYSIFTFTILITIFLSIIPPFIKDIHWGVYLISSCNGFATILLAYSRYLNYDSHSAQYEFMAKQFSKLLLRLEYENSFETPSSTKKNEIQKSMLELNEHIQELIPEEAVQMFPLIYRTNIIQFIKKQVLCKKNLIIRFRDIKNEIHYILYKWNLSGESLDSINSIEYTKTPKQEREKNRIIYLMDLKEKTKKELIDCKNTYIQLNELFKTEIRYAETHQSCFGCSGVFKPEYDIKNMNSVIRDYLILVMPE